MVSPLRQLPPALVGGGSVTCTVAVPDRSPAVAMIVTSPAWIPVASPVELIVATTSSELVHVNSTSGTAVPSSVVAAAWNSCMPPTSTEAEDGLTVTTATTGSGGGGSVTCTVAVPDRSPAVAVIVTSPAWIPVASPVELIVATTSSELVHVKLHIRNSRPVVRGCRRLEQLHAADFNGSRGWSHRYDSYTGSGGGGSVTCTVAVPDRSPAVAMIVTSPAWIPVASPVELIVPPLHRNWSM